MNGHLKEKKKNNAIIKQQSRINNFNIYIIKKKPNCYQYVFRLYIGVFFIGQI